MVSPTRKRLFRRKCIWTHRHGAHPTKEKIAIQSLWHRWLNNFSETYLDFGHTTVENYERGLLLNEAFAYVKYDCAGVHYERTYFTSYPDRVMVVYLTASKPAALSFTLRPTIPFVRDYSLKEGDQAGKSGSITAHGDTLLLSGRMHYYNILFEGQFRVLPQGGALSVQTDANGEQALLRVEGADSASS